MQYIDLHCDSLARAFETKDGNIYNRKDFMVDIKRLKENNCTAQFFAVFVPPVEFINKIQPNFSDDDYIECLYKNLTDTVNEYSSEIAFAKSYEDFIKNQNENKVSAFLTLEEGRSVMGSFEKLEKYYDMGIRLITFTWNFENCFGYPNSKDKNIMNSGLKPFGKQAVEFMNQKGMIIDVSHLSDGGFWDVLNLSKKPVAASHSSCRSISPHPRNLTDEMIKALGNNGGVCGINFCPAFVAPYKEGMDEYIDQNRTEDIVRHILYMANIGGSDCVAIGSDFDGIGGKLEVGGAQDMHKIWDDILKAGYNYDFIEKIAYKNAQRLIKENL